MIKPGAQESTDGDGHLGEDEFAVAWAHGEAMSPDEIAALALAE